MMRHLEETAADPDPAHHGDAATMTAEVEEVEDSVGKKSEEMITMTAMEERGDWSAATEIDHHDATIAERNTPRIKPGKKSARRLSVLE